MNCPYCRESIAEADNAVCPDCHTPHHADCWEENRGCTVFGCASAPADEPKISISSESLPQGSFSNTGAQAIAPPPLPGFPQSSGGVDNSRTKLSSKKQAILIIVTVLLLIIAIVSGPWPSVFALISAGWGAYLGHIFIKNK